MLEVARKCEKKLMQISGRETLLFNILKYQDIIYLVVPYFSPENQTLITNVSLFSSSQHQKPLEEGIYMYDPHEQEKSSAHFFHD